MPWAAAAAVGGQVLGGVMGDRSARRGADAQQQAASEALAEQRRQFDATQERQLPFHEAGVSAVDQLRRLTFKAPTAESVQNEPGYAFGLREGMDTLEGSAANQGNLYSGNTLKRLLQFGQDYAGSKFNDAFERERSTFNTNSGTLTNLANLGTGAAAQLQNAGANFANQTGNLLTGNANAQAASGIARANNWQNTINQGISTAGRNNWWQGGNSQTLGYDPGVKGYDSFGSANDFKDGGPVLLVEEDGRYVPKVGSRSPRRGGGTGGGLSEENLLRAIVAAQPASAPASGVAGLPANPLTSPAAIQAERERRAGIGYADGGPVMVDDGSGRMVPKVGTRSARPSAGGGQMSREAILAALTAAQSAQPAASAVAPAGPASGVAGLPANPVMNPNGVRIGQMQALGLKNGGPVCDYDDGGPVHGPGGPRDDAIPARLSNGEFVLNARAVKGAGGGDTMHGMRKLNALQALLEGL